MEIEEARKEMNSFLIWDKYDNTYKTVVDIKEVNQLQEVINAMANEIYMIATKDNGNHFNTAEEVIEYFTNKAKEDIKE